MLRRTRRTTALEELHAHRIADARTEFDDRQTSAIGAVRKPQIVCHRTRVGANLS